MTKRRTEPVLNRLEDSRDDAVDLQLDRRGVHQRKPLCLGEGGVVSELREGAPKLRRVLLKVDVHHLFAAFHAFDRELQGHRRLPRASRPHEERGRPGERPAIHELVESFDTGRKAFDEQLVVLGNSRRDETRIQGQPVARDAKSVLTLAIRAASQLEHAKESLVARRQWLPRQLHDRVGDRELGQAADVGARVFAEQECGHVVGRQQARETRHERPHVLRRHRQVVDRAKRVDDDDPRGPRLDRVGEPGQERPRSVLRQGARRGPRTGCPVRSGRRRRTRTAARTSRPC